MILGIDVGGTHTDAVLIKGRTILHKVKVLTDREDIGRSLVHAATLIIDAAQPARLERAVLSTTISTNAIVENTISPVAMILAHGPGIPPSLLAVGEHSRFISGYVNHRGISVVPVDRSEVESIVCDLQEQGIHHVGIVGKFSPRNPGIELDIEAIAGSGFKHVSLGHRMSGNLNYPRRIATTFLNAAVWNICREFISIITASVGRFARKFPLYILKADGGTLDIHQSLHYPVQTILSGPAASIMGILSLSECRDDAVALDIGGTTTDIALLADGVPLLEPQGVTIANHKTLIRGLRTRSIGVGGDSAVVYEQGTFVIGPERLGPAAAFGGPGPTPTDAMIVLGLVSRGDRMKAVDALRPLAEKAGCSVEKTAEGIFDGACRKIAVAATEMIGAVNNQPVYTVHELLEGRILAPKVLYVAGGPAAAMAPRIGALISCTAVVPPDAEVANAVGAALARTTTELTLLADTEKRILTIVEEGIRRSIPADFSREEARSLCLDHLKKRAMAMGARKEDLVMEITEDQSFNMIRGFVTTGRNIRIRAQIKPGLIASVEQRRSS
ncbi:MAG: hydantoinase/oxoprolinase family protein [Syntrophales bacterium]|jgi:N-methylhydantoinase A/oxoprolinase/acetone carboxylase beta subunit|nr:hydantoinase/oxoprolinase family protein [Syntrophales bacterium]MCK9527148.1 hydantoinase/oxoprolinase family protein [Syntrophales bacterium]MDX9921727.1 hydantoinase/oxoprolinase family protein [Syntrophales bacterium]